MEGISDKLPFVSSLLRGRSIMNWAAGYGTAYSYNNTNGRTRSLNYIGFY